MGEGGRKVTTILQKYGASNFLLLQVKKDSSDYGKTALGVRDFFQCGTLFAAMY